jgi:nitroimidazol reductase NimA-like FMN-containing flavoprotein (pyridoxamine 5'-phosphate oxidase superfamily)
MTNTQQPLNKIRRSDRAKDDGWISKFLLRGAMGTLGTSRDNQPFLVTRNYAYDPNRHAIYLHGARKGRTFENLQINNRICFSVSQMGRLLPAGEALEVGIEYAGVVVFGNGEIVEDPVEAIHGLRLLLEKYFPNFEYGVDYKPILPEDLSITAVIRIDIHSWSGKEKAADDDYPGAFNYKTPQVMGED